MKAMCASHQSCVSDGGGEETAAGRREAQTGLHQEAVPTRGVEMEERVSVKIVDPLHPVSGRSMLASLCLCSQDRRRDLPPAEEAGSFSGLEPSVFHHGSSKITLFF